jgi:hypothetical protein
MDMLLTGVPHFRVPTGRRIDHRERRRSSTETYRQHELLCSSFAAGLLIKLVVLTSYSCGHGIWRASNLKQIATR